MVRVLSYNNYLAGQNQDTYDESGQLFAYSMTTSIAEFDSDPIAWGFPEATSSSCYRETNCDLDCKSDISGPQLLEGNISDKSTVIFESDILSTSECFSRQRNASTYYDSRRVQQVDRARGAPNPSASLAPGYCDYPSTASSSTTEYSDFTESDSSNQSQCSTQSSAPASPSAPQPAQYASATQNSLPGLHFTSTTVCPVLAAMNANASTSAAHTTSRDLRCWEHNCNGRKFSTLSNLARHQREKAGDRMVYVCQKCRTSFVRRSTLQDHLSRRTCSSSGRC